MGTEARKVRKRAKYTAAFLIALSMIFFAVGGFAIAKWFFVEQEWSPLGPYPRQTIAAAHSGRDGNPTISLSNPIVPVNGTKCADPGDYRISGTTSWISVNPRGVSIVTGSGERDAHGEGSDRCVTFDFQNEIPPPVLSAMRGQLRRGVKRPLWRIVGVETPSDGDREGVSLSWRTETFGIEE